MSQWNSVSWSQGYPKNDLSKDADEILRNMSLVRPEKRMELICGIVRAADGPCGGEIAHEQGDDAGDRPCH